MGAFQQCEIIFAGLEESAARIETAAQRPKGILFERA
jgi:hypothetical protein